MNKLMPGFTAGAEIASTSLLVAGMHRSGTSALARVLSLLGAELPRTLMRPGADNPKGFWESAPIAEVNDALLSELGSSWDDVLALLLRRTELKGQAAAVRRIRNVLSAEFSGDASAIVVKEPRIALLLDVWLDALSAEGFRPRIIIPLRNPLEVSASLATRSGFAAGRSLLLWLVYFLAAERSSRGAVRSFVHYPNLLEDWRGVMRRLEHELGFTFAGWTPTAELEIDSFLSNEDRHQIVAPHLLAAREDIVDWIKRAYQWGLEAAAPGGAPDPTVLDAIASEFTAAMRVFAPVIAEQRTALQAGTDRIAALRQDLDQREGGIAALRHDLDQREGTIAALTQDLDQREERIAALGQELNQREERIAALGQELDRREGRIAGLRNDVESLTQTADARLAELGDLGRELASRAEALADLGQQVAQRDQLVGALRDDVAALARKREADVTALRREVAGLRISESRQAARLEALETSAERRATHIEALEAHVEALEASARSAMACVEGEAGERRGLEIIAAAQREFIERSMPLGRRVRRALWRRPLLRPFSYAVEFAGAAVKLGPVAAAKAMLAASRLRRSGMFDEDYYLAHAWDVRALGQDPVVHYVIAGAGEGRDPSPSFSTGAYCRRYPDVARSGANPLYHYVRHGRREGRAAAADVDASDEAGAAPERGQLVDLYAARPDDAVAPEARRGAAYMERFRLLSGEPDWAGAVAALNAASAAPLQPPAVSVIVPVYGQLAYTLNCLDALLTHRSNHAFEVIVVDDRSPDASREWLSRVRGVRVHARAANGGFIAACNDGARQARGRWLVFLNNDTRVVPGWLDALIDSFAVLPDAELVGSKLFYSDGSLQEAGGIIWRDGSAWNFGRNDDPGRPDYCYARPVDYVSGASIAIAHSVWNEIGGFDERYAPAYGEDSDLALKIRYVRGKQVWMQPLSRVIHYEGKTSGVDTGQGVKAHQVRNAKTLYETWKQALGAHRENADAPLLEKDRGAARRALVIDATTPEIDKDAGSLTCFELMRALQAAGYAVSFAPEDNLLYVPAATPRLQQVGIRALYYPYVESFERHLRENGGDYDLVMIFRLGVADRRLEMIRELCPRARVIFHSSDLHFLREERHAEMSGDPAAAAAAARTRARELAIIAAADAAIVHSTYEQDLLAKLAPAARVYVFPWILEPAGRTGSFSQRRGLAFLGGYRHTPNVDAVLYFVEHIWPRILARRPDMTFIVAGSECPETLRALHGRDNIEVVGFVEDLAKFFAGVRLSVAPIRYGAGIKGKVAMSLAHGVPTVATSCAAEGMGLQDGEAVIIRDDPAEFAQEVLALYDDEQRWTRMSDNALGFVELSYGTKLARRRIEDVLALAGAAGDRERP